jgi:nitroreductase
MLKQILQKRITTKWWLPTAIESEKLNEVLDCAYMAPSKQGKFNHKIYVISDSVEGRALKEYMFWEDTFCLDLVRGKQGPGLRRYNGQVNAPIVLVWIAELSANAVNPLTSENEIARVRDDCIVSATMAMCAAEALGLQTGFCGCIGQFDLASKITGVPVSNSKQFAVITMGIGYGHTEPLRLKTVYQDSVYPISYPNTQNKTYPNAYELLLKNKNFILSEVTAFINDNVKKKTLGFSADLLKLINVEKCQRDCNIVIGALLHDLQFDSSEAMKTIASHYWNDGFIQVKRVAVEQLVYEYLKNMITTYIFRNVNFPSLQTTTSQHIDTSLLAEPAASELIDMLISIILQGLAGNDILPIIGNDLANIPASDRTPYNRRIRPSKDILVKYI